MAITIDYSDTVTPQFVINIPKADLLLIQATPTEIRQLNINDLRIELGDLQDDAQGVWAPTAFFHTPPLTISGVTLARVVEILDPYVIEFEDDLYNVNVVGGNSNISDKTIKNQVGVNTANSAGLQDPFTLQASAFLGEVTINVTDGYSGTTFPKGTNGFPSNNLADALIIAEARGIGTFKVVGDLTITAGDYSVGYIFRGDSPETSHVTLESAANLLNCTFKNLSIDGVMDGQNSLVSCRVGTITMFQGDIHGCAITGPLTLGPGTTTEIVESYSQIPGGGPTDYPVIDMGGATGTDLIVRHWDGGFGLQNLSNAARKASLDINSGRVIIKSDVTAGEITIRGIADVQDDSTGTTIVNDNTLTTNSTRGGLR